MSQSKLFSIRRALSEGWQGTKSHFWFLLGLLIIYYLISAVPSLLDLAVPDEREDAAFLIILIGLGALSWLVQTVMSMGVIKIALRIITGQQPNYPDLFTEYKKIFTYIGASFLYSMITFFGLLLFIVPGIYWAIKYYFFAFRIVDANEDAFTALRTSGALTQGVKRQLLGFISLLWLINILGLLALVVGLLVTIPLSTLAIASVYRQLNNNPTPAPQSAVPTAASVPTLT